MCSSDLTDRMLGMFRSKDKAPKSGAGAVANAAAANADAGEARS